MGIVVKRSVERDPERTGYWLKGVWEQSSERTGEWLKGA